MILFYIDPLALARINIPSLQFDFTMYASFLLSSCQCTAVLTSVTSSQTSQNCQRTHQRHLSTITHITQ